MAVFMNGRGRDGVALSTGWGCWGLRRFQRVRKSWSSRYGGIELPPHGGPRSRCREAHLQVMLGLPFANSTQAACCFMLCC